MSQDYQCPGAWVHVKEVWTVSLDFAGCAKMTIDPHHNLKLTIIAKFSKTFNTNGKLKYIG